MIFLKKIFLISLTCVLIICGLFMFLFGTKFGVNLVFMGITHRIPGLVIESVSGSWNNFDITHLIYDVPSSRIEIDKLCFSINLQRLLFKQIKIENFFAKNVLVTMNDTQFIHSKDNKYHQKSKNSGFILNLYKIFLENVALDNILVISNNIELRLEKLNTSLIFQGNTLQILFAQFSTGSVLNKIPIHLFKNVSDFYIYPKILSFSGDTIYLQSKFKSLMHKMSEIILKIKNVPINIILTDIQGSNLRFYFNKNADCYLVNCFQAQFFKKMETMELLLNFDFINRYLKIVGNIILNDLCPINLHINYKKEKNPIHLSTYKLNQVLKNIDIIVTGFLMNEVYVRFNFLNHISKMCIVFKINLKSYDIPIDLLITGNSLFIPVFEKSCILDNIYLHIVGNLRNNYCVNMQSELFFKNIPKIYATLTAQGNINSFNIALLQLKILDKNFCSISGNIDWGKRIFWNSTCIFNDINFSKKYFKFLPMELSGKISTQGHISYDSWKIIISNCQLNGKINNNLFSCYGKMQSGSDNILNIPIFFMKWDSSILKIYGKINKNNIFNIFAFFKGINVSNFFPQIRGNVNGYCKLYGSLKFPKLSLDINIPSLVWKKQSFSIKNVFLKSNVYWNKSIQSNLDIIANQIQYKDFALNRFHIQGRGNINKHYANIEIFGKELSGKIDISGKFDVINKIWSGKIYKTNIVTFVGTWKLIQDIEIIYQYISNQLILKSHNWENIYCKCVVSKIVQDSILNKINLICQKLNFNVSDTISIDYMCIENLRISFTDLHFFFKNRNVFTQGTVLITGSNFFINCIDFKSMIPVVKNNISVRFVLSQYKLCGDWHIFFNDNNVQNYGNFCIDDFFHDPKIIGKIYIKDSSVISVLQFLLQSQISYKSSFNANISFSGDLNSLKVYGYIDCIFNDFNTLSSSFLLKKMSLKIVFLGNSAKISGIVRTSSKESFYLNGNITEFDSISKINVFFSLTGNQCIICLPISPDVLLTISPSINFFITPNSMNIKGSIDVLAAEIKFQEFPKDVVRISSEEIILNKEPDFMISFSKENNFFNVVSDIFIRFGDNVNFDGLGLHAKLKGNLEIVYDNNGNNNFTVIGHINIFSGYLEAYGQNFTIRKGQLLFPGPISQAYLDIEVVRNSEFFTYMKESVTAGIQITGTLNQQLKFDFFSDSMSLSQQKILSYLLGGNNSLLSGYNETNTITSFLIGAGSQRYGKFINKIGHFLGVKDLKINSQNYGPLSLISFSGYIAPGLQLKYGIDIFDLLTSITIRYYINPSLYLETTTFGRYQGLDLFYQFHF